MLTSAYQQGFHIYPASKINGNWIAAVRSFDAPQVQHPDSKGSLLYVTRRGNLFLLFQNENGIWHSISHGLDLYPSMEALISHAALGEHGNHLLLVTHNEACRLRLFKVNISWNPTPNPPHGVRVAPTIEIGHLTTLERVAPQHSDSARLTHLRIMPPPPLLPDQHAPSPPDVLAVYTHASSLDAPPSQQDGFNVVARWNVESVPRHLHDCFSKLKASGATPDRDPTIVLARAIDIITNKVFMAIDAQCSNAVVAFGASDGTVDYYDRSLFIKIEPHGDAMVVTSLAASGFVHMPGEHRPHIAISPDGCALVSAEADGSIEAKTMTNQHGWHSMDDGTPETKALVENSVVCLARQYLVLSYSNAGNDEPLALLPQDPDPTLRAFLVKQILAMAGNKPGPDISMLDSSRQQVTVLRDPYVARALSAQLALGTNRNSTERNFEGQFAYTVLNLKTIGGTLAQIMSKNLDLSRPDMAPSLVGLVRWVCDLMVWLVHSITSVKRKMPPDLPMAQAFEQFIESSGSPAIHLLLCSFPRALLRFHAHYIQSYMKYAAVMIPQCQNVTDRQKLVDILEMTSKLMPFQLKSFQDMVTEFDASVRKVYTDVSVSAERRTEIELRMITEGHIPEELHPALQALMFTQLPALCEKTDMSTLYFWDTQWLNITQTILPPGTRRYDVVRKTPLTSDMDLRVCRKCESQTEDVPHEQLKTKPMWLIHGSRSCLCMNFWWLI